MKKTISFIFSIVLLSCSDSYVDLKPEYSIDSENFFNVPDDYEQALVGAYDLLQTTYLNAMLAEIASDNTLAGGESATDVPGFQQIDDMIHTPINSNLKDLWNWMFAGVQRAAYIIEFRDKIDFQGKESIIAQAYFLRAYFNFELVKWFGPIPIKEEGRFIVGDELSIPRYPVEQVYELIFSDLTNAIEFLEIQPEQKGRISKGAAQALLGKAYLYQKMYDEAAATFETIINSEVYALEENYSILFENDAENGVESVFEIQYTDLEGASFDCFQCSEGNIAVGFNGIRQYNGPLFDSGFSFNVPTKELYDLFDQNDTRRDVSILNIVEWAKSTGASYGEGYEHTGFFNRKYIARKGDSNIGDQNLTNPNNYRAIRYSDVLLMAAESNLLKSNPDLVKSKNYLNEVRERAFKTNYEPIQDGAETLLEKIYIERRLELCGEGHRFFDLVRTNQAASHISGFTVNKHELFPIPLEEIEFSNGNWSQNQGY